MIRFASFCYGLGLSVESKLRAKLEAFAKSLSGPLGNVPLDRAIRADLELFRTLRESGATWPQIANSLAAVGARRPDGAVITADHVRSAVSRQLKRNPSKDAHLDSPNLGLEQSLARVLPQPTVQERTNPENYRPEASKKRHPVYNEPNKDKSSTPAVPTSSQRNQSILEKLARTRKLREP